MATLVTGIGYIGAKLVDELLRRGESVVAIDNLFSTDRRAVERLRRRDEVTFIRGSVNSPATLATAFSSQPRITTVFCLAAQSSGHPDAASARYTEITNLLSPRLLLDEMRKHEVDTIVYGSTFWVYGKKPPPEIDEQTPYGAFSDLSHLSKCYAEKLLQMYAINDGLRCVPARLGIVYGVSPVMKRDYRFMTVPNKFCLQAVRREDILVSESAGRPMGFVHIEDACRALIRASEIGEQGDYLPVNVVGEMLTVHQVASLVTREAQARRIPVKTRSLAAEELEAPRVKSRLDEIGFAPEHKMETSLGAVLDYFLEAELKGASSHHKDTKGPKRDRLEASCPVCLPGESRSQGEAL